MITSDESSAPVTLFFDTLCKPDVCPALLSIKAIMIDKSDTEIKGIRASVLKDKAIRICFFHTLQAVGRFIKRSEHGLDAPFQAGIISHMRQMKLTPSRNQFKSYEDALLQKLQGHEAVRAYILKEWLSDFWVPLWANCRRPAGSDRVFLTRVETNNLAERFFKGLKYNFLEGKANKRIDNLIEVSIWPYVCMDSPPLLTPVLHLLI